MKKRRVLVSSDQKGAVVVVTAFSLLAILGFAGLAVDLGYLYVVKCELQRAADAGAMAGARAIYPFPLNSATLPLNPLCAAALTQGRTIAQANLADGASPTVGTIQTGAWDWNAGQFTQGCAANPFTNTVALTTRRDNLSLVLMGLLGFGPINLSASSIAVMDWVGSLEQGAAFPMVLGKKYAQKGEVYIYLNPDPLDAGGWYTKDPQVPNNNIVRGYLDNPATVPAIKQGEMVNMNNGAWANVLAKIQSSYLGKTVWLPVVDTEKFNQSGPVEGFTAFTITEVETTGHKYVKGMANPLQDAPGSLSGPGGANYGLLTSPRLVQ
ncbi:MAG TPA: pilus assembly protein TadG-related protein [Desulfobaccales bacterium]